MTETAAAVPDDASELASVPYEFAKLSPEAALQPCDGHASGGITAVVAVRLPSGRTVVLCGNCARKAGYEHAVQEDRQKGSVH